MNIKDVFHYRDITDESPYLENVIKEKKVVSPVEIAVKDVFVGIEVEVERVFRTTGMLNLPSRRFLWGCKEDGSLRNNGKEFVSIPIKGDSIALALTLLNSTLNKEKNCLGHEFSERTSVHVHVNVQDFTTEQLACLVLIYLLIEPLIYNYTGNTRYKNIFCVPLNQSNQLVHLRDFFNAVEVGRGELVAHELINWPKYTGFNLQPVSSFGTVEFRHMYGTSNVKVLSNWINILLRMHQYAKKQDLARLKSRIFSMNTTSEYMQVVYEIFGDDLSLVLEDKLDKHMEEMVIYIKDIFVDVPLKKILPSSVTRAFRENPFELAFYKNSVNLGWMEEIRPPKYTFEEIVKMAGDKDLAKALMRYTDKYDAPIRSEADVKALVAYLKEDSRFTKQLLKEIEKEERLREQEDEIGHPRFDDPIEAIAVDIRREQDVINRDRIAQLRAGREGHFNRIIWDFNNAGDAVRAGAGEVGVEPLAPRVRNVIIDDAEADEGDL